MFPANKYPFSPELCSFMDSNPAFFESLKLSKPERFILLPLIFTSYPPYNEDEVIGIWYLDKKMSLCTEHNTICLYKQDFIVNVNFKNQKFISYSTNNKGNDCVKSINEFFSQYGRNGKFYHNNLVWEHHYKDIEDLPDEPNLRNVALIAKSQL